MCSWILATLPAMSPTVVSIWARAMRTVAAMPFDYGWAPRPIQYCANATRRASAGGRTPSRCRPAAGVTPLGPGRRAGVRGRPAPGPARPERPRRRGHRRLERPRQAALQAAQRAPLASRVEEDEDVAALERLQHLVARQADAVAQDRVGDVRARGGGVGVELDLGLLPEREVVLALVGIEGARPAVGRAEVGRIAIGGEEQDAGEDARAQDDAEHHQPEPAAVLRCARLGRRGPDPYLAKRGVDAQRRLTAATLAPGRARARARAR